MVPYKRFNSYCQNCMHCCNLVSSAADCGTEKVWGWGVMNFICNIQKQSSTGDLSKSTIVYKRRPYIYTRYRPRSCEGSIRSMPSARIRFYFLGIPRYLIRSCCKGALRLSRYSTIEYSTIQYNTLHYNTIQQRFPNCGPPTPRGSWGTEREGSAGNYCFLVEFRERMCTSFYTVISKNLHSSH